MKVAAAIVIALIAVGCLAAAFAAGLAWGLRRSWRERLREFGLNKASAVLYTRAVKILLRLEQKTTLDGLAAGDRLSPDTQQQVDKWATDFRIRMGE